MNIIFIIFILEFFELINNEPGYISISGSTYITAIGNIDGGDIITYTSNQISIYDTNMLKKQTYTISNSYPTSQPIKICQLSSSIYVLSDLTNFYIYNTIDNSFTIYPYIIENSFTDNILECYQNSYFIVASKTLSDFTLFYYDINLNSRTTVIPLMSRTILKVSCIALEHYIILFHIIQENLISTNYIIYSLDFTEKKDDTLKQGRSVYTDINMIEPHSFYNTLNVKSTIIEENSILICVLKSNNILYCVTVKIIDDDLSKISPITDSGNFEANNNCDPNYDISIGLLSNLKYASICGKESNSFLLSITKLNGVEMIEYLKNKVITNINNQIYLVRMNNLGLGIFYNNDGGKFSIAEYPVCKDISFPKTDENEINTETEYSFDFSNYILNDILGTSDTYLVKVFPYDYFNNSHNEVQIYHDNELLSSDTTSYQKKLSITNWKLKAGKIHSDYKYTFKVYYSNPYLGVQKCFLNIKISCSEHCLECDIVNSISNCKKCDTNNGYYKYPLDGVYICKQNSTQITGYYLSSTDSNGEFLECHEGCIKCYNPTNQGCMTAPECTNSICCNKFYYPLEDHNNECYKNAPDGYYKDETNEIFKKCPSYCKTCNYEDSTEHICNTCNTDDSYYPLELNGLIYCYLNENRPNGYFLYIDNDDISKSIFKKCNYACDTCSEKENSISTNCINCKSSYFEDPSITGSTFKNCITNTAQIDGFYFDGTQFSNCPSKCSKCSLTSLSNDKCLSCNKNLNYYPLYKKTGYLTCITESEKPTNTYFDTENEIFLECYSACATCSSKGTLSQTNCLTCAENYISLSTDSTQCIVNCPNYYYIHNNQNKCCNSCPISYPFLYPQTGQCYKECPKYLYNKICYDECPNDTILKINFGNICYDIGDCESSYSSTSISKDDISSYYDTLIDEYLEDYYYTYNHISYIQSEYDEYIITIFKNDTCTYINMNNDLLMLDLSDCPSKLREKYDIDDNTDLTILLINFFIDDSSNQIEYYFYNSETKENLDLSPCSRINVIKAITDKDDIDYDKAIKMSEEGINVFDINDEFFTSICYEYKTENGTDMTIADRIKDYYQNVTCDNGCSLNEVNLENYIINCSCSVSQSDGDSDNIFDNKVTGEIYNFITDANFEVLECYHEVFQFKFWIKNYGNFTILTLLFINTIFLIVYIIKGLFDTKSYLFQFMKYNPPKKVLQTDGNYLINKNKKDNNNKKEYFPPTMGNNEHEELISTYNSKIKLKTEINNENNSNNFLDNDNDIDNDNYNDIDNDNNNDNDINNENEKNIKDSINRENDNQLIFNKTNYNKSNLKTSNINEQSKKLIVMAFSHNYFDDEEPIYDKKQQNEALNLNLKSYEKDSSDYLHSKKRNRGKQSNKSSINTSIESKKEKLKPIRNFDDDQLDKMDFHYAIKYDKRKFCDYYCKLIKQKQNIINTFFVYNPMKPFPIKVIAYCFMISVIFTVNCLFITESYISDRYNHKGKLGIAFILNNAINRIFYSVIVCIIINYCVSCLFDSEIRVKNLLKREEDIEALRSELYNIIKKMKTHFLIFIICTYLLMFFFWYYLSAFCNCYNGTQKDWFYGSLICIFIVEIYPFILCLIRTLLWYIGVKCKANTFYKLNRCLF